MDGLTDVVAGLDLYLDRPGGRVRDGVMEAIRDAIRSGRLVPGIQLPSSRALAADLGVARNTVARAYAELFAEGWLTSLPGSGTLVAQRAEAVRAVASPPKPRAQRRLNHDFRPGHPDLSSFPRTEWSRAVSPPVRRAQSTTAPINGVTEIAGPEAIGMDDFVRAGLAANADQRRVVTDAQAPYFGAVIDDRSLASNENATIFTTQYSDWIDAYSSRRG